MKNCIYLIIFCLCFSCKSKHNSNEKQVNVLLIGNSLTYYSDMPQMLQEMLNEAHPNIKIHQSTFPGMSLDSHLDNIIVSSSEDMISTRKKNPSEVTQTEKKIKQRDWDVIVLQTGTVGVLIPEERAIVIDDAIKRIKALSSNADCKYILFSTWASKITYPKTYCYPCDDIDKETNGDCCSPEIKHLEQHVTLINNGYTLLATKNSLIKSQHTDKAYEVTTQHPEINLYLDDIHPNKNGAFLNACIFYKMLTSNKPSKLKYTGGIDNKIAYLLKKISN